MRNYQYEDKWKSLLTPKIAACLTVRRAQIEWREFVHLTSG